MSSQKLSVNTLREMKSALLNKKYEDIENEITPNITEILLLLFNNIYQEGYDEISLKEEDVKEYITELKKVLKDIEISTLQFVKKSIKYSSFTLKDIIIRTAYEEDYGYYDEEKEKLYISINRYPEYKNDKISSIDKKIIETLSKIIIKTNKQTQPNQKKLTNKNNS